MIPEGFITNLLDRADIVDVVGRYVPLKKTGRNFQACCPFHKEKTPSFNVSPAKQFFKCFGCGKSGNAIGFLMAIENLGFPEAVEKLAGFYGMEVPRDRSPRAEAARARARSLSDYMREAADFYTARLRASPKAIEYLKGRAISGETAARFGLGYSPEGWHGLQELFGEKYADGALLEAGLVNEKNGRRYDAFRDRLMFPIRSAKGLVIGFGARTLKGDEQPKYLNSPETPIYHKGSELYGLYEGRNAIREKERAIVCEGYMDVIQLSQAGFGESVAALGTSITPEHVKRLFKLTDRVYFSFDGDAAGRKAARRALEAALPVIGDTQRANFILLPPEHDPDSLIKAEGPEAYEREIENALPLTNFVKLLLLEGKDLAYAEERARLVAQAKGWILSMQQAPVLRLALMKEIAGLARLELEDIERQYGLARPAPVAVRMPQENGARRRFEGGRGAWDARGGRGWGERRYAPEAPVPVKDVRDRIVQCFLCYPALLSEFSGSIEEAFVSSGQPAAERVLEVWRAAAESEAEGRDASPAALMQALSDSPNAALYTRLLSEELVVETPEEGARIELKRAFLELELERTKARILEVGRSTPLDVLQLRTLTGRRSELERLIAESRTEAQEFRRRSELERHALESGRMASKAGAMKLSSNPRVRRLQEHLFGAALTHAAEESPELRIPNEVPDNRAQLRAALASAGCVSEEDAAAGAPTVATLPGEDALEIEIPEAPPAYVEAPPPDDIPWSVEEEASEEGTISDDWLPSGRG